MKNFSYSLTIIITTLSSSLFYAAQELLPRQVQFNVLPDALQFSNPYVASNDGVVSLKLDYRLQREVTTSKTWRNELEEAKKTNKNIFFSLFTDHSYTPTTKLFIRTNPLFETCITQENPDLECIGNYEISQNNGNPILQQHRFTRGYPARSLYINRSLPQELSNNVEEPLIEPSQSIFEQPVTVASEPIILEPTILPQELSNNVEAPLVITSQQEPIQRFDMEEHFRLLREQETKEAKKQDQLALKKQKAIEAGKIKKAKLIAEKMVAATFKKVITEITAQQATISSPKLTTSTSTPTEPQPNKKTVELLYDFLDLRSQNADQVLFPFWKKEPIDNNMASIGLNILHKAYYNLEDLDTAPGKPSLNLILKRIVDKLSKEQIISMVDNNSRYEWTEKLLTLAQDRFSEKEFQQIKTKQDAETLFSNKTAPSCIKTLMEAIKEEEPLEVQNRKVRHLLDHAFNTYSLKELAYLIKKLRGEWHNTKLPLVLSNLENVIKNLRVKPEEKATLARELGVLCKGYLEWLPYIPVYQLLLEHEKELDTFIELNRSNPNALDQSFESKEPLHKLTATLLRCLNEAISAGTSTQEDYFANSYKILLAKALNILTPLEKLSFALLKISLSFDARLFLVENTLHQIQNSRLSKDEKQPYLYILTTQYNLYKKLLNQMGVAYVTTAQPIRVAKTDYEAACKKLEIDPTDYPYPF